MKAQKNNLKVFDTRDVFFNKLYELAKLDKNIIFLTADMGANSLERFKTDLPSQYFNLGIAEQNTILVAVGLALTGKKVFVYGITPFITERCFEQIKVSICYMNLPITIIGIGTGFSYGVDGPTHYSVADVALLSTLSNIVIYGTSDKILTELVVAAAYENTNPVYVRLERGAFRNVHTSCDFSLGYSILKKGEVIILSTGKMIYTILSVVEKLEKDKIGTFSIADIFKLRPLNISAIDSLISKYSKVIVVEEHLAVNGLGSEVRNIVSQYKNKQFLHLFVRSDWNSFYGDSEYMLNNSGLDKDNLYRSIKKHVVR